MGKEKPIWSISEDASLSAGQWLSSQATRRLGTQSCNAGSIGVVIPHVNYSESLKDSKITIDYIHSGEHKVDGSPYIKMPDDVRSHLQSSVDNIRTEFATAVSRGTKLSVEAVLGTEAQVYRGKEAVEVGLIEEIVDPIYLVDEFNEHLASAGTTITLGRETIMNDKTKASDADKSNDVVAAKEAGKTEERARISGILTLPEAKGRGKLASTLTANGAITVESAKSILSAAALEVAEETEADAAQQALDAISAEHGKPLEAGASVEQNDLEAQSKSLASNYRG